jgi:adenine deaminase
MRDERYNDDMTHMNRVEKLAKTQKRIGVALGEIPADCVIRNANLVNVFTEEIYPADILISDDRIAAVLGVGQGVGTTTIDASGLYAAPTLLDSHFHLESTLVLPHETAKLLVPRGVTTIFHDPHEIANVFGMKGLRLFRQMCAAVPMRLYLEIPSLVPSAPSLTASQLAHDHTQTSEKLETTGGSLSFDDIEEMLGWAETASLGELDPMRLLPPIDEYVLRMMAAREHKVIVNGHAAGLSGRHLQAFITSGIFDDHQCTSPDGAIERARLGMRVAARQGKRFNLPEILKAFHAGRLPPRNFAMCVDDKFAHQIVAEGHMDFAVRNAIRHGLPPIQAIQGATINTAEHFHLQEDIGSVSPGRYADIVLLSNLVEFKAERVMLGGKWVSEGDQLTAQSEPPNLPEWSMNSVHLARLAHANDFVVAAKGDTAHVRVMDMSRYHIRQIKVHAIEPMMVVDGNVQSDVERDILKVAVVERYCASGRVGKGFVRGLGLQCGAMASSISHDHHNITVIGTNDADMALAVNTIAEMHGGLVCVANGAVCARVPLAFGGLMSVEAYPRVVLSLNQFLQTARDVLGCTRHNPLGLLPGLCLTSIPELGLTDLGLLLLNEKNAYAPRFIDLLVAED